MRITLAQLDPTVGAIQANAALVLDALEAAVAAESDLLVVPELALTGYPPEDLLLKEHFIAENRAALDRVAAVCTGRTSAVIGFVDMGADGRPRNAAALCRDGAVEAVYHKRELPNYGVFDERRYFAPGDESLVVDIAGVAVALTVCEDIWVPGPASDAASAGAQVVVNLSASPFHTGKAEAREQMLRARARENGAWLVYVNLAGGQDELVFDGRSATISPDGEVVARAVGFEPRIVTLDIPIGSDAGGADDSTAQAAPQLAPLTHGEEEVYAALVTGLRDYVHKNGFTDVVIGLSGGIDSALAATVAADALGPDRVHGVLMPGRHSSAGSVDDARALAANLGIDARLLPIEPAFSAYLATLAESFAGCESDVTEENLQARVRGTLLMALSNKFGWLVLATGNKSELSVGYSTLYGDMVGGFAPLKDVFKQRVYALARWRNAQGPTPVIPAETISKPPSAELRPDQTDQDSLPPYDVLDAVLERYVELDMSVTRIIEDGFDPEVVAAIVRLTDAAEYKRRQGAPGTKITPKAFGRDRRMPVTNAYKG